MTWKEYHQDLVRNNPKLFGAKRIAIDVRRFEEALRRAFEAGESEGFRGGRREPPLDPFKNFFGGG